MLIELAARASASPVLSGLVPFASNPDEQWFNNPVIIKKFWPAVWETLGMVGVSTLVTVALGLPLGLLLASSSQGGVKPRRTLNQVAGGLVNILRSFPFMILMIALIPFTRLVMGAAIGWKAMIVPLVVGAVPFFARLVENNVSSVDPGKIEAAQMMGASNTQIEWGVQIRESLPGLVQSATLLFITLIGYSAMAGAIGGGGLGALAINYGYNQWMNDVMVLTVVAIMLIVQVAQMMGDMISRLVNHR